MKSNPEALAPFTEHYRKGLCARAFFDATALFLLLTVLLVALDAVFVLSLDTRLLLLATALVGLVLFTAARLMRIVEVNDDFIAAEIDRVRRSRRHETLTGLQVSRVPADARSADFVAVCRRRALEHVENTLPAQIFPRAAFRASLRRFLVASVGAVVLLVAFGAAAGTTLPRYVDPWGDHPPYTTMRFTVEHDEDRVPWGGTAEARVILDGEPGGPVRLITSDASGVRAVRCFTGAEGVRSQRIENVTGPVRYWFETIRPCGFGTARSRRYEITPFHSPEFTSVTATVLPPAYTGREAVTDTVTARPVAAPVGSVVEIRLVSNRPLDAATVRFITPPDEPSMEPVDVKCFGHPAAMFEVTVRRSFRMRISLEDIEKNRSREYRTISVACIPDERPDVSISAPPRVALATPDSTVPVTGSAVDDYGLTRLRFVRSLGDFRDDGLRLPVEPALAVEQALAGHFDLAALGVTAGETIEYYAEARDNNPDGSGYSTSRIHTLKIISTSEYLEMRRRRATLRAAERRLREPANRVRRLRKRAREIAEKLADPETTAEERKELRRELQRRLAKTAEALRRRADGPHLYDIERDAADDLRRLVKDMERFRELAEKLDAAGKEREYQEELDRLLAEMGDEEKMLDEYEAMVDRLVRAARLMQQANELVRLAAEQRELERKMDGVRTSTDRPGDKARRLESLAEDQAALRERLAGLKKTVEDELEKLPAEEFPELHESSREFLRRLGDLDIPADMEQAESAGEKGDAKEAWNKADAAALKLESLIDECKKMAGSGGGGVRFSPQWPGGPMTLQQLMAGMGTGSGQGQGSGMSSQVGGDMAMFGPGGMSGSDGDGRRGAGQGPHRPDGARITRTDGELLDHTDRERRGVKRLEIEAAPEKYRDALDAYFGRRDLLEDE